MVERNVYQKYKKQKKKQWENEKEISDIRWREGNKKLGHFMREEHDAWSYLEPCSVCTITCKKIDKGPGVGDVNGTSVVADSVSHTYTNNSCTVSTNSQHLPIRSHYKTCSHYIHTLLCQYVSYVTWSRCMARHSKSFLSGYVVNHRSRFRLVSLGEFEEYCQIWLLLSLQRNYKNNPQSLPHLFPGLYFL